MELLENLFYTFGAMICHQLPTRTLLLNDMPLPVCARDTGIYIGMFVSLLYLYIKGRWKSDKPPKLSLTLALCLLLIPMMLDGVSSYVGFRTTNNLIRVLSGGFFGMGIPFFLLPLANFKVNSPNKFASLNAMKEILIVGVSVLFVCISIYHQFIVNWWFISAIIILTIVFIYFRLLYTIVCQLIRKNIFYRILVTIVVQIILFGVLFAIRVLVFYVQ